MVKVDQKQERLWAMLCHLTALLAYIGIPFGNIIGPLVVWSMKKNDMPSVDREGKESLNFQISITIYCLVAWMLAFIIIGVPLLIGLAITNLVLIIVAAIKANNGEPYHYPLAIRFLN